MPEVPSSTDLPRNSSKRSRSAEVHNMSEKVSFILGPRFLSILVF